MVQKNSEILSLKKLGLRYSGAHENYGKKLT